MTIIYKNSGGGFNPLGLIGMAANVVSGGALTPVLAAAGMINGLAKGDYLGAGLSALGGATSGLFGTGIQDGVNNLFGAGTQAAGGVNSAAIESGVTGASNNALANSGYSALTGTAPTVSNLANAATATTAAADTAAATTAADTGSGIFKYGLFGDGGKNLMKMGLMSAMGGSGSSGSSGGGGGGSMPQQYTAGTNALTDGVNPITGKKNYAS